MLGRWRPSADSVLPRGNRHLFWSRPRDDGTGLHVVATTAKWVRDLVNSQHTENQRHELQPAHIDPSTYVKKRAQRSDDSILLRHMDDVWVQALKNIS